MPAAGGRWFRGRRPAISHGGGEGPPHSSTEGGYAPLGLPRPTPPTDHPRRPSPKSRLRRHSRRSTRGTGKRPPRLPDTPHLSASTLLHSRLQYSPRQRSTRALAACQSYERNIRRFTTGCAAEENISYWSWRPPNSVPTKSQTSLTSLILSRAAAAGGREYRSGLGGGSLLVKAASRVGPGFK